MVRLVNILRNKWYQKATGLVDKRPTVLNVQTIGLLSHRLEKLMRWTIQDIPDQSGRVAVVTGGNSGIGFETVRGLAQRGAHVILACRDEGKGNHARAQLLADHPDADIVVERLDLADLQSVRAFASRVIDNHDRLDLLVNNAGVMVPPFGRTADGFELQFGTNHLGHFALTGLLLDRINATPGGRVVIVSSVAHKFGKVDFDNLNAEKGYKKTRAYALSKLANLLFQTELQRRLEAAGHQTLVTAAHPGWTATNLQAHASTFQFLNPYLAMTPAQGALPTLFAATSPDAKTGRYYGPNGLFEMRGVPVEVKPVRAARDPKVAQRLWEASESLTGVSQTVH